MDHFGAGVDGNIKINKFFEVKEAVEVIEASNFNMFDEVIGASEVFRTL